MALMTFSWPRYLYTEYSLIARDFVTSWPIVSILSFCKEIIIVLTRSSLLSTVENFSAVVMTAFNTLLRRTCDELSILLKAKADVDRGGWRVKVVGVAVCGVLVDSAGVVLVGEDLIDGRRRGARIGPIIGTRADRSSRPSLFVRNENI